MDWSLHYPSWMIADGEPDREVGESFDWFAVEFWTEQQLSKISEAKKSATPIADHLYSVTAEIAFLSEKACVIDFGLKVIRTSDLIAPECKQGDYVAGEIGIGLPLCVEMAPEEVLATLNRKWKVNRISADLTPFIPDGFNSQCYVRDVSRIQYLDVPSTRAVSANDYILHCTEI